MITGLRNLLEEISGMDTRVLGDKNLSRIIRERMSALSMSGEERYLETLRSSPQEKEALIEAMVVPETSFFRDKKPFAFLGQYVREQWIPSAAAMPFRILSAPCSTGEEPYSIAMVLQESGLKAGEYEIDALDISRDLLRKAERAAYTLHSFRGVPDLIRNRYFLAMGHEYVLRDAIRQGVRFTHGDLLDDRVLAGKRPYDAVFCRNLLIYLRAEARARLLKTVDRLTDANGVLFVGHAETSSIPAARYGPLDWRGAFVFRKLPGRIVEAAADLRPDRPAAVPAPPANDIKPRPPQQTRQFAVPVREDHKEMDSFGRARKLADLGRLSEAADECERLLLTDKANSGAYCLLGTVLHGMGNLARAEECFTRAIYLDERCYDAVMHLSLIKEHRGDLEGAEILRRRAARIQPQTRTM